MRILIIIVFYLVGFCNSLQAQKTLFGIPFSGIEDSEIQNQWVDSVYQTMSRKERIGQLFMVAAYSNRSESHKAQLNKLIKDYHIGGLIFFQGTPYKQAVLTNYFQSKTKLPLFIAMDAEWGLGMRLDSTISFPRQLTLGAIKNDSLIYKMGKEIAWQCRRLGVHINFAPVVDVNNNINNPVINNRSFGEDKFNVALKGLAYMEGMQDNNVMACAKHFPGHGDTDSDSHLTLPVIKHNRKRLDNIELYPFKILVNHGVESIMAAHIHVPALDSTHNMATSMSKKVTTTLLRDELGFRGLVFSDALNMKGVSQFYKPGEVEYKAYLAGNDILLFAEDVPRAVKLFVKAFQDNTIDTLNFEKRVKNILVSKYELGLSKKQQIELSNLTEDLNRPSALWLKQQLYEASMVLATNKDGFIPIRHLDTLTFASVSIGDGKATIYQHYLSKYAKVEAYTIDKKSNVASFEKLLADLKSYNTVFVSLHDMSKYASKNHGITANTHLFIEQLNKQAKVMLTVFGSPYALKYFDAQNWLLLGHEEDPLAQKVAAQVWFGAIGANGYMPVTASNKYTFSSGVIANKIGRLRYTMPEAVGFESNDFKEIDSIAIEAINDRATPGCQILVLKDGQVIYEKGFGYHTYNQRRPVKTDDIYDLASITKIAATTISLMYLHDLRQFQPNRTFADYLPDLDTFNIRNLTIRDVMNHTSGLQAWIPFYLETLTDSIYKSIYSTVSKDGISTIVANNFYIKDDYRQEIFRQIYNANISDNPEYKYSDLGFYLFKEIVEQVSLQNFEEFTSSHFYAPLGMATATFNPLNKFSKIKIVPTEHDKDFRKQVVHGYVHDPGAAMLGGVSGHAGLFSSSNDLAILMQMLLNKGEYAGERYLKSRTVQLYTKRQTDKSRRGMGFDKPEPDIYAPGPTSIMASERSFGHSGFTGTCVWVDPDYDLVYVFLSNRVHPKADNYKLIKDNVRTKIHDVIYESIYKSKGKAVMKVEN